MKKFLFIISLIFTSITGVLTSCSEDYPGPDPVEVTANYSNKYYSNSNLSLLYSGESITGKSVDFSTVKGETGTITLYDIIPGEKTLSIFNIPLVGDAEGYSFSGSTTGTNTQTTFNYKGRVAKKQISIELTDIKMGNSDVWADDFLFSEVTNDVNNENRILTGAAYVDTEMAPGTDQGYNSTLRSILSYILPQFIGSISLKEDGNITATYSNESLLLMGKMPDVFMTELTNMDMWTMLSSKHLEFLLKLIGNGIDNADVTLVTNDRTYQSSPTHLAYWYPRDGKVMVKLDIAAIITQIAANSGKTVDKKLLSTLTDLLLQIDAVQLKSILIQLNETLNNEIINIITSLDDSTFLQIASWLVDGIPMNVEISNGHTHIYLNKEALQPLFVLLPQLTTILQQMLSSTMPETVYSMIGGSIEKLLTDCRNDWPNAVRFNIGLDFVPDNQ